MKAKFWSFLSLTMLVTGVVSAQSKTATASKTSFGLRAGINFQNLNGKDNEGNKMDGKLKVGFHAGANAEIPVGIDFYLQPGLLFTTKGAKYDFQGGEATRTITYLELPVNFLYKPELGDGRVLLGFGPYAALALGGKIKGGNLDVDMEFGNEVGKTKAFDAGANFLAGYEFSNRFSFQLNAGLGLINMYNRSSLDSKTTIKNTGFGLSVGYRFQ